MGRKRRPNARSHQHKDRRSSPSPGEAERPVSPGPFMLSGVEEAALLGGLAPLVPPEALEKTAAELRTYIADLVAWNIRSNLVAAGDRTRLVRRHVVESLACVPLLDELGGIKLLDLGSGGGFPGIPIKLVRPWLDVALVESRRMKSLFLRREIESLGLRGASAWQARIEEIAELPVGPEPPGEAAPAVDRSAPRREDDRAREPRTGPRGDRTGEDSDPDAAVGVGRFPKRHDGDEGVPRFRPAVDLVTSRAVASLSKTASWVAPIVRQGGALVTFKGSRADEEVESWCAQPGPWELFRVDRDVVPGLTLVALRKSAADHR